MSQSFPTPEIIRFQVFLSQRKGKVSPRFTIENKHDFHTKVYLVSGYSLSMI